MNLNNDIDPKKIQDGVAPQCGVPGLTFNSSSNAFGRVPFLGFTKHKNFVDAHLGANYGWVLTTLIIGRKGYVKPRK
jgi:hypothetical protein